MAAKDENRPEALVDETETPTGDVTLAGTKGADLASTARSPELAVPAAAEAEDARVAGGTGKDAAPSENGGAHKGASGARPYRPSEDYAVGDHIFHPIWNVVGVVVDRESREQIFRLPVGRTEERGRCHMIKVEFEKDVPAAGGPRREVTLIADWHGRSFEVGAPPAPAVSAPESLAGLEAPAVERPAVARTRPALPEIPDPDEELDVEDLEEEEPAEEDLDTIGI